ncbi:hypothetical protein L596_015634 [Steinernema carpocapsae]|uniref:SXP/RAL-2 family protein Ani s 5-like cation-binding domain-containing protein n=1 Tax=Steinernema carpocapsae TaxID=34508 RepID=A0A4U5NGK0_STECR|nr:hypothetical protein L596_015634 [Steinernema carpocapsae]
MDWGARMDRSGKLLACTLVLFSCLLISFSYAKPVGTDNPAFLVFYHKYPKPLVLNLTKTEEDLIKKSASPKTKTSNVMAQAAQIKDKHPEIYEKVLAYKIKRKERKDAEESRPEAVRKFIDERTVFGIQEDKNAFPGELKKAAVALKAMKNEEKKVLLEYYPNLKIVLEDLYFKRIASDKSKLNEVVKNLMDEFETFEVIDNFIAKV